MNPTKLVLIAVISVIVLATGYFLVYRHRQAPTTPATHTARQNDSQNQQRGGPMTLSGKEQTYIVASDYVFIRRDPNVRLPEEALSNKQLQEKGPQDLAPCLYYGESVLGEADTAHPDVITLRAPVQGYGDGKKFWLQPPLDAVETSRYLCVRDSAAVHVVPHKEAKEALALKQGEVVEADGKLDIHGTPWIRATFNPTDRPRRGFILASDLTPLFAGKVDESHLTGGGNRIGVKSLFLTM